MRIIEIDRLEAYVDFYVEIIKIPVVDLKEFETLNRVFPNWTFVFLGGF